MPDVLVRDVRLYDEPIGTLTHLQGDRTIFAFNEDYVENPDRPTLSLSFKDDLGGLITNIRPTQRVVPPFFSNLLPEGGLSRYLAERAGVNQQREFFLLWVLGLDLPGARRFIRRPVTHFRLMPARICRKTPNPMRCVFRSLACSSNSRRLRMRGSAGA